MKNVMRTLLVMGMLVMLSDSAQANLLLHWAFDEAAGATQAADSGPSGSYTAIEGGGAPTFGATGVAGNAVQFNGSTDWLQLPYTTDLVNASFTLSFWLNETNVSVHQMPLTFGSTYPEYPNGSTNVESGWQMFRRKGAPSQLDLRLGGVRDWTDPPDMAKGYFIGNTTTLARGSGWHHLVITVQATGVTEEIDGYTYYRVNRANYLDGQRIVDVNTFDTPEDNILYLPQPGQEVPLSIGARVQDMDGGTPVEITYPFNGLMDDVQYYTNALSAAEVEYLYANPGAVVPEPATLVLLAVGGVAFLRRRHV
ncbi:MAG: PEP-CTERM sorting domain-containing protein [Sedimentisphaerales bacterium]|nr:PEP-CTERM sorting domain-containing protein [Sedimentisphaerales bacterium]